MASPWVANRGIITAQTCMIIYEKVIPQSPRFLKHAVCRSKPFIVSKSTVGKNKVGHGWRIRRKSINATEKGYGKLERIVYYTNAGGG